MAGNHTGLCDDTSVSQKRKKQLLKSRKLQWGLFFFFPGKSQPQKVCVGNKYTLFYAVNGNFIRHNIGNVIFFPLGKSWESWVRLMCKKDTSPSRKICLEHVVKLFGQQRVHLEIVFNADVLNQVMQCSLSAHKSLSLSGTKLPEFGKKLRRCSDQTFVVKKKELKIHIFGKCWFNSLTVQLCLMLLYLKQFF